MVKMKKLLSFIMAVGPALAAHAYEYPCLTFQSADGSTTTVSVESLTMTVAGGNLVVKNAETEVTLALAGLGTMYFTDQPAGITAAGTDAAEDGVEVFTLSGLSLGRYESAGQAEARLGSGVYVMKTGKGTRKAVVK